MDWFKWDIDASRIIVTNRTTIAMACRDNKGFTIASVVKRLEMYMLISEVITIRKTLRLTKNMDKTVIESNSQLMINSIKGLIESDY